MADPLTEEELTAIKTASSFLVDAPPGEINDIFSDVRVLVGDDLLERAVQQNMVVDAFEEHNVLGYITATLPGYNYEVIVSKYGQLEDGRYLDPRGKIAFYFDHMSAQASVEPEVVEVNPDTEPTRTALDNAAIGYLKKHYPRGAVTVYDTGNDTYAICIVSNRFNPNNYWNGRWKSTWTVDKSANTVKGNVQIQVHYFEDGNVQLNADAKLTAAPKSGVPEAQWATSVLDEIARAEREYQLGLNASFADLAGSTFKALRRALPVTKAKIEWSAISNYKVGNELPKN
ncbi:capping protein muscle Z-line, alpha 2 [Cladochytrium replicatum]|nr:capping protein muscle Z-line, alpha 2 [Cladochytrium replicatum]